MAHTSRGIWYPSTSDSVRPASRDFRDLALTANAAVDTAVDEAKWVKSAIPQGSDLNDYTEPGGYPILTNLAATSIINAPTLSDARTRAVLNVHSNLNGNISQQWVTLPNAPLVGPIMLRSRDDLGMWSPWTRIDATNDAVAISYANVFALSPGVYSVQDAITARTIENRPPEPIAAEAAIIEVLEDRIHRYKIIRWSTRRPASIGDSGIWQTQQDTGGTWDTWRRIDAGGDSSELVSGVRLASWNHRVQRSLVSTLVGMMDGGKPVWAWSAPAGRKLATPTHEGSGQATHPSVLHIPGGFGGYEYWMAMTPYPYSAEEHEDPDILASHDGETWVVPAGLTNPLDDAPGQPGYHNSDTHLAVMPNGDLICTWRAVDRPNDGRNIFYARTSSDGVTWTPRHTLWLAPTSGTGRTSLSPAMVWMGDRWRLYVITSTSPFNTLSYYESSELLPGPYDWSERIDCAIAPEPLPDRGWWHVDVQLHDGEWLGIMNSGNRGSAAVDGDIHFMRSAGGDVWEISNIPLAQSVTEDHNNMYKAGFIPYGSGDNLVLDVFYSAYIRETLEWHIYRTTAEAI